MSLGVAAAGRELEAIMRTARGQPLRYGVRVSFQNHGQVRAVSLAIEMPQEGRIDTVKHGRFIGRVGPEGTNGQKVSLNF
jgi:hypothetical protein